LTTGDNYDQSATGVVNNPSTVAAPSPAATVTINVPVNTYDTNPNLYYQVWAGTATNGCIQAQIQFVQDYFVQLRLSMPNYDKPKHRNHSNLVYLLVKSIF